MTQNKYDANWKINIGLTSHVQNTIHLVLNETKMLMVDSEYGRLFLVCTVKWQKFNLSTEMSLILFGVRYLMTKLY